MNDIAFVIAGVLLGMLGLLLNDALRQRRQRRAQEAAELARHIERRMAEADRLRRRQDAQHAARPQAPKARPAQAAKAKAKPEVKPAAPVQAAPQANAAPALLPGGLRGNNMFAGEIVAFTGTIPGMTRREAMQAVEANGGKAYSTMPAAATLLVVGEKPGSEKLELAERRCGQVRRIDAAHFKFMLEQDLTVTPNEFAACFAA